MSISPEAAHPPYTQSVGNIQIAATMATSTVTAIGFSGAGGKAAIKADNIVGITSVGKHDDVFIISRLSKIIRFQADEIPPKEGIVQGVNCIALRADEVVAVTGSQ